MTQFELTKSQIATPLSDEVVILNYDSGVYFSMNETGTFIYKQLETGPKDFTSLSTALLENFDIDEKTAQEDLSEILEKLTAQKLITIIS